jgi:BirA family transcriptional regulator, biotin operon repressor / biotin---[acetyl-CoA-carboxylase] ligase
VPSRLVWPPMFDLLRIQSQTTVRRVEYHASLTSTNDLALQLLRDEQAGELPVLVLAERQTAGRGRGDHRWWSSQGALTFSLVSAFHPRELPLERRPLIALAAGLAVRDALGECVPSATIQLKWPNDVYLNGRKVCGILIELPARPPDVCVIGIGVNVHNSFVTAPPEVRERAIALADVSAESLELTDVLIRILQHLGRLTQTLVQHPDAILDRWRTCCILTGRWICLRTEAQRVNGWCQGIDRAGRLIIDTQQGTTTFSSGTIESFSPAAD